MPCILDWLLSLYIGGFRCQNSIPPNNIYSIEVVRRNVQTHQYLSLSYPSNQLEIDPPRKFNLSTVQPKNKIRCSIANQKRNQKGHLQSAETTESRPYLSCQMSFGIEPWLWLGRQKTDVNGTTTTKGSRTFLVPSSTYFAIHWPVISRFEFGLYKAIFSDDGG